MGLPGGFQTYRGLADRVQWYKDTAPFTFFWVSEDGSVKVEWPSLKPKNSFYHSVPFSGCKHRLFTSFSVQLCYASPGSKNAKYSIRTDSIQYATCHNTDLVGMSVKVRGRVLRLMSTR